MAHNGFRPKGRAELSEYQKKVEAIDSVILCVAEAEKMVHAIGTDLLKELPKELLYPCSIHKVRRQAGKACRRPGPYPRSCLFRSVGR